ncbi:acyl-CoA dehydrogenase [Crossiella sp. CA198]|uniref:acyl-CoA dehydrogenase n=1 Tax=Crossiella sp. CA198 TaxID=3455607 RepID=UPI003F8D704B
MGHYKSNLRDLEFNLFEVFKIQERLGKAPFEQADEDTARGILSELNNLATGPLAESFADADRNPPVFDPKTHSVALPESLRSSYAALQDGDWGKLYLPEEQGGYGLPRTVQWAAAELILGANPAVFMYLTGPSFSTIVHRNGTEEQQRWAQIMLDKGWTATMVLTEPDAGSDVGAGRTKAVLQEDGSWHLDGVKRFITSAEHDLSENIMHLVLARPEGPGIEAKAGTKGLSLFLVPKFHFDTQTGELGERNGAYVTNVEHKMGLKASTTCELTFGQHDLPAKGWLLGEVHDGIAQMFQVIEYARMMVGTKAIATLSTGYLNARDYAKERVQSADLTQMLDKTAPRVTITNHPDVRRILMLQKAYTEGLRAVYLYTATFQDSIIAQENTELAERVNDLLLPIVKGVGSERAYELLALSLQTLGGSGFLQDYPIEQYIRDAKIDTLYEGTTAIQSLDFFFRKIVRDKGQALGFIASEIQKTLESEVGNGRLKEERALLKTALEDVQGMLGAMIGFLTTAQEDPRNTYKVGQNTVRLLMSAGDLLVGWQLLRQAEIAITALDGGGASVKDQAFYQGKLAAASFFTKSVLPELTARRKIVETTDNGLMDLDEAAF